MPSLPPGMAGGFWAEPTTATECGLSGMNGVVLADHTDRVPLAPGEVRGPVVLVTGSR